MRSCIGWRYAYGPLVFLLSIFCCLNGRAQQGQWEQQTLSNGMTVRYCQDSTRELLHLGLTLRGGASWNTGPNSMGLAHLYEHLFFQLLPDSSPAAMADDQGIFLAHHTRLESHFFGMSVPPPLIRPAMIILATGLMAEEWSDSSLETARTTIAQELQDWENSPENHLAAELNAALWQQAAGQRHLFGTYSDILRIGSGAIRRATQDYRHPGNCVLTATGAASGGEFFALAEQFLGYWEPESEKALLPKVELPKLDSNLFFVSVNEFAAQPLIMMAWPVQGSGDPALLRHRAESFCTVAALRQGGFYRRLVDGGLAHNFTWSWAGGLNPGQLMLHVFPVQDSLGPCVRAIYEELARMGSENGIPKEDVTVARRLQKLHTAVSQDQSMTRLIDAGQAWLLNPDPAFTLPVITAEWLQAFCRQYLSYKSHVVAGLLANSNLLATMDTRQDFRPPAAASAIASIDSKPAPKKVVRANDPAILRSYRVYFDPSTQKMDTSGLAMLGDVAAMLLTHPEKRVYINSFSEGAGDGVHNYQLTVRRAKAARIWLHIEHGVPLEQVVIRAYGEAFPEFPDENDLKNRRLTFDFAPKDAHDNAF
jgi:outer membrane protein OmpA-like peptidoglycan-associated protein